MAPTDVFAIVVLIACILVVTYLIISAVYFNNLIALRPPSRGESSFLFWTSLLLGIVFIGIGIFAIIRIFTYRAALEPKSFAPTKTYLIQPSRQAPTTKTAPAQTRRLQPPTPPPRRLQTPAPAAVVQTTTPRYTEMTDFSTNVSDLPIPSAERQNLTSGLLASQSFMDN